MCIAMLIAIAVKPSVTIRFFKNGTEPSTSFRSVTGFLISSQRKKTKNKNAILQMNVKREKNESTFISSVSKLSAK